MKRQDVAAWLSELHSHSIYDVAALSQLEPFGVMFFKKRKELIDKETGRAAILPVADSEEFARRIEARGLGGRVDQTFSAGFTGWEIAETLRELAGLADPAPHVMGRGSRFRMNIEALRGA